MYILLTLSKEGYFYKEVACVLKSQRSGKNLSVVAKNPSVVA